MKTLCLTLLAISAFSCAVSAQETTSSWEHARDGDLRSSWNFGLFEVDDTAPGEFVLFEEPEKKPAGIWDGLTVSGASQTASRDDAFMQPWLEENGGQQPASLGLSQNAGEYGTITLEGSPAQEQSRFSIAHSLQTRSGWLRGVETRLEANSTQTLFTWAARFRFTNHSEPLSPRGCWVAMRRTTTIPTIRITSLPMCSRAAIWASSRAAII